MVTGRVRLSGVLLCSTLLAHTALVRAQAAPQAVVQAPPKQESVGGGAGRASFPSEANQGSPPPAAEAPADAGPQPKGPLSATDEAKRLFAEAESQYEAGNVNSALALMQACYKVCGRPELLFNLGELQRELGQCRVALTSYQKYLHQLPHAHRHQEARQAVLELSRQCPDPVILPSAQPAAPAPVTEDRDDTNLVNLAGWISIGTGVALGAGAAYFAVESRKDQRDVEKIQRELEADPAKPPWDESDGPPTQAEGNRKENWAWGLGIASAICVSGGATLLLWDHYGRSRPSSSVTVTAGPYGVEAGYSGRF